jgi:hypothetical protein
MEIEKYKETVYGKDVLAGKHPGSLAEDPRRT